MHETYFLSQNLAFFGIYILDGESDTFSYLGGFVALGIYIYGEFATLVPYLDGFVRLYITFTTSLPTVAYIHEEFTSLFPYPGGFVRLSIYIYTKHSEKILARAHLIAEMAGVAINKRRMKKKT
jgi:hypothetical protein